MTAERASHTKISPKTIGAITHKGEAVFLSRGVFGQSFIIWKRALRQITYRYTTQSLHPRSENWVRHLRAGKGLRPCKV